MILPKNNQHIDLLVKLLEFELLDIQGEVIENYSELPILKQFFYEK